jgi:hypothetical protein
VTGQSFIAIAALVAVLAVLLLVVVDHLRTESPSEELPFVRSHRAGRWSL